MLRSCIDVVRHLGASDVVQARPAGLTGDDGVVKVSCKTYLRMVGQDLNIPINCVSSDHRLIQACACGHAADAVNSLVPNSPIQTHEARAFPVVDGQFCKSSRPPTADKSSV